MAEEINAPRIQPPQLQTQQLVVKAAALEGIVQEECDESFQEWIDQGAFNPTLIARRFEQLELKRRSTRKEEAEKTEKGEDEKVLQVSRLEEISEQYQRKNPELHTRSLLLLRSRINQQDKKEDILRKVLEMYPDYSLADEAIDFLLETSHGELATQVRLAKELLNEQYGREVRAGRNIAEQAREFSSKGLGNPTGLRDIYREYTGNPRDSNTLFNELSAQFDYQKMVTLIDFLLHSLGGDLKSKGPSIDHAELHRLLTETRKLQSILGIYRFFKSRMKLIAAAFARNGLSLSSMITFEFLSKLFMKFLQERYPSSEKLIQLAEQLGYEEEWIAHIIILTQLRDGVRGVAPKLFKSEQHRHDILKSYMDAIEELDERIEEEEEGEEEEKEEDKDKKDEKK
ncbi:MAG TPA: type III secretion system gatekeeper subunit SctW [Rhabdochlamydiaceae bacterium]|jgi:type III secretion protein W